MADSADTTLDLISFINASPTASHATRESIRRLETKGFKPLDEKDKWSVKQGDKFYVTRNMSSVIAVRMGSGKVEESGFRIVGAHTDFPGFRLKPNGVYSKNGYIELGVEVYGGPIIHSWLDRDLSLAGKLVVREDDGSYRIVLFDIRKPVCRIPNLAPHIRPNKTDEIRFNKQDHLPPVIGMDDDKCLLDDPVLKLAASTADGGGVDAKKISAYTIEVYDFQPGTIGGISDEFVFTRCIDNLASCHAGIDAMLNAADDTPHTQIVALFDNEEVGSSSMQGAGSGFLDSVIERVCMGANNPREAYFRALANSLMVSADGAHAVNPNYPEAHEPRHQPILNGGPVVKINANERYTNQIEALEHLKKCAEKRSVPLQTFVARTDVGTGSTIGPMTASRLGVRSIDIGSPMLSMHSVREMGGVKDQKWMVELMAEHFS